MGIFVVIPVQKNNAQLQNVIKEKFSQESFKLSQGEWIISYSGTSKGLCDALGITDGKNGSAVVFSTLGYYGRASSELWEWLQLNWGDKPNV